MSNSAPPRTADNKAVTVIGILVLIAVLAGMYFIVEAIREAGAPLQGIQDANRALQTQVSRLMNPTPTIIPEPVTYIHEVRALARLETIQYSVEKVITAEVGQGTLGFLFGDKMLFIAHGTVIAGVDMQKLRPEDMRLEDGVLYVSLPAAEVFVATLDNEQSSVYDRDTGLLTKGEVDLETVARQAAEAEIRNAALEDGILAQAGTNAEAYLLRFFSALGYKTVVFETPT
jgi:hypothetical protein